MNIEESLQIVKDKIPEGYDVVVKVSKNKILVELETPNDFQSVSTDGDIVGQILSALDQAIDDAESFNDEI